MEWDRKGWVGWDWEGCRGVGEGYSGWDNDGMVRGVGQVELRGS